MPLIKSINRYFLPAIDFEPSLAGSINGIDMQSMEIDGEIKLK